MLASDEFLTRDIIIASKAIKLDYIVSNQLVKLLHPNRLRSALPFLFTMGIESCGHNSKNNGQSSHSNNKNNKNNNISPLLFPYGEMADGLAESANTTTRTMDNHSNNKDNNNNNNG